MNPAAGAGADFAITEGEYRKFGEFFYGLTGVSFLDNKRYFVDRRIVERARVRGCLSFRQYYALLRDDTHSEIQELINLLTVNETYFLREDYQFESLVRFTLPEIASRKRPGDTIRIWSLPCSTGEEPYSIAISVLDAWEHSDHYQVEIMGSDIDTRALGAASAGVYGERSLQHVGPGLRSRYFRRVDAGYEVVPELRHSVDFSRINITDKAAMARVRDVDVVFCRNMLIYFDDVSRREAVEAIYDSLADGGFVYLGHSESMSRMSQLFAARRVGESMAYQRPFEGRR